jgi:hypothetical protein
MTIAGGGAVAIWHDIVPAGRDQFYAWHGVEHMPERVGIPGFRRGRRYIAYDADLEFFNLYETENAGVVASEAYRQRLNNPTPWTLSTVKHFRSVARCLASVAWTRGAADGGLVATLRYDLPDDRAAAHVAAMTGDVLPLLDGRPGIAAAHFLVADMAASGEVNAEQRARGTRNDVPRFVVLVEGWGDEAAFRDSIRESLAPARLAATGLEAPPSPGFYRCQITHFAPASPRGS